jgi:hypothetical protein
MGVLNAGSPGHPPGLWSRETVRKLLRSRTYTGEFVRGGIIVPCPQIIDSETWRRVQERLGSNKQGHIGRPSSHYLLVNYLWCGKCQHRCTTHRTTHRAKVWGQYRCGNFSNKPPLTRYCDAPGIGQAAIETAAFSVLWGVLTNRSASGDGEGILRESSSTRERRLERTGARIGATARPRRNDPGAGEADAREDLRGPEIEQDIRPCVAVIREKLRMAERVARLPSLREAEASLREILDGPMPETYQDRRKILDRIGELRMTYLDGELEIAGRFLSVPKRRNQRFRAG